MTSDNPQLTKMSGYLEKKGRKKMMSCYKKYWFVLEGRLLLYYKSKDEYDAISPCKGSISLGATCNVKPCTSNIGVFLIENKTTTITLRAENRTAQHQWMHAIMSALNQVNNGNRLYHFRYSVGELSLPPPKETEEIEPVNTTRQSSANPNETKLIEKLRRQGAQACGINTAHFPNKVLAKQRMSLSHESLSLKSKYGRSDSHVGSENPTNVGEDYDRLDFKSDQIRVSSVGSWDSMSDAIYEKVHSDDSVFLKRKNINQSLDEISENNNMYCDIIRDRQDASLRTSGKDIDSPDEVLEQNPVYGLQDRPKKNVFDNNLRHANDNRKTFITENDCYWSVTQNKERSSKIDCNDNTIKLENARVSLTNISTRSGENMYYEANQGNNNDDLVEYVDITYTELDKSAKKEDKKKRRFSSFYKKNKSPKEKSEHKIMKSESFLRRVFIKHRKKIPSTSTIQSNNKEIVIEKVDTVIGNLKSLHDKLQLEIELANSKNQEMIYDEVINDDYSKTNKQDKNDDESQCPILPPRNNRAKRMLKDIPINHSDKSPSQTRTQEIDEILDDLNKESQSTTHDDSGEGNVKKLIKRFSMGKDDGVEIRLKKNWDRRNGARETSNTDSSDLNKLLDELAKVTTAPIMTPGVTTSLINPEITDAELMNIIPIRTRRLSDPDYDIPRPHRSLTNIQKKDNNALQATRFFGPILNSPKLETHQKRPPTPPVDYSSVPSMTPDSLEVTFRKSHQEDHNSYHSHEYLNYQKHSHNHIDFIVENNLYDDPRLLYKARGEFRLINGGDMRKAHYNQEMENNFVDSLET
ncbi:uncharacterized protein LOC143202452 isoform X2 [Rhynchophorus ferrugineus]|uniref:uncharacterized protein LOC143202452 isoform X2 n=1 Tax=Rhynchophorus ferrugineus TaxID=354439 RepID=UPI003FCCC5AF